jgi:outer membrane receptor protein involved in Fe transport
MTRKHPHADRWIALFAPLLLVLGIGRPAGAQEPEPEPSIGPGELRQMDIEQLMQVDVSTISRADERLDLAPGTIYVYSRQVIQDRGYRSLGELLQTVPGFTVFHRDWQYVVGIRGLNANDNDKMSLLINGQRVLGLHEQELLNGPINLDDVERVEVVVGPSSLFQQADTLAATVNLITRNTEGGEGVLAAGNALAYSATLMGGKRWAPDRFVSLSITSEMKRGFDAWPHPSRPYLPGRDLTGRLDWPSYFGVLAGQYGDFSAQAVANRIQWVELHISGADPHNDGRIVEDFYSLYLKHEHAFTGSLTSIISLEGSTKGQVRSNKDGPPINATAQSVKQRQYRADAGLRFTPDGHRIQAGIQGSFDDNYDTWFTFDETTPTSNVHIPKTTLVDQDTFAVGFYGDDEFQVLDQLKLVGGVRVDHNQRLKGSRWYPGWRSAVVYQPVRSWVTKLLFFRAVRMPSAFQALNKVFGTNNPDTPSKPAFANLSPTASKPEQLTTIELQNIFYFWRVRLGTTVYHQWLRDFITWFQPHSNGGDFRGFGAEVTAHLSLGKRFTIWGNGAWNDSRLHLFRPELFGTGSNTPESFHAYVNRDDRIIGSARYTGNLGMEADLWRDLRLSPTLRYFTDQAAVEFRPLPQGPTFRTITNRLYVDATLSWRNLKRLTHVDMDLRLSGYNLSNNRAELGAQLFADTYRPRGIAGVLAADLRF